MNHKSILIYLNVLVLIISIQVAYAEKDTDCITPRGETAKCVSLPSCPVMIEALQTKDEEALNYIRNSHCGFEGKIPLVCCGTLSFAETNPVDELIDDYYNMLNETRSQQEQNIPNNNEDKEEDYSDVIPYDKLPGTSLCGLQLHDGHTHGEETDLHEFPWTATLEYEDEKIRCVGTIISNRYILTAASCLQNQVGIPIRVRLGEWNVTSDPDCKHIGSYKICTAPIVKINIAETIPHHFYNKTAESNDIGLIKLEKDITFTESIRPICLPSYGLSIPDHGTSMVVTGWGITTQDYLTSDVKLKGDVSYLSIKKCKDILQSKSTKINLLRGCGEKQQADCRESLGGPVMRKYPQSTNNKETQWYLEGIVCNECDTNGGPVIYTTVSRYISWIMGTIHAK